MLIKGSFFNNFNFFRIFLNTPKLITLEKADEISFFAG